MDSACERKVAAVPAKASTPALFPDSELVLLRPINALQRRAFVYQPAIGQIENCRSDAVHPIEHQLYYQSR
jgi:hypothetical protein